MAITIAIVKTSLRIETDDFDTVLARYMSVADAYISKRASAAPTAIKDEAAIRMIGYLYEMPAVAQTGLPVHATAWRQSGAASLIAPWRTQRALKAEDE